MVVKYLLFFSLCLFVRCTMSNKTEDIIEKTKQLAPRLTNDKHKGQAGRIGVFGGSIEFTGAPYFASISSLKVGADLVYLFTNKEPATVIKSYSPELMVLPILNDPEAIKKIEPWLERLHVVVIGPGLGRNDQTFEVITKVIETCRQKQKPLVIDADGLFLIAQRHDLIKNYPAPVVLTPNVMEFNRLVGDTPGDGSKQEKAAAFLMEVGSNVTLLCKDHEDEIISRGTTVKVSGGGSGRRCGGQGDILAGSLSTFLAWSIMADYAPNVACYAACRMVRDLNSKAFVKYGRSMTATDMIPEIHEVFEENFERK
ncbi:unnamed protein product [Acanthoscelides obtectus]|uniref:ATP-dependent (S)-NAD(P)H-hydrate dehydratase n=1 Tax=Acanthoscelides obtectus TaxID=200917 RepID=A0A9P0NTY0_ACAOB|nr:unnamed protein product [Acanthoscelides obtectus]CAK1668097.1 ATP-dependent (S)-NAD(P)H-hydrate dehydratase [Acanthoscelides obtectus]